MPHHIRWQILLIVVGILLVAILLAYLAVNYTTVLRPGRGGTYVEGVVGSPSVLNPLLASSEVDRDINALVFSGLTRLNAQGEVEPDLAHSWDISLDGLSYTFHLRTNAYWHDGVPLTADDVIFTIGLLQDAAFPGPAAIGASVWQAVETERVDRRTVRFTLTEPYPFSPFLDYTTIGILPVHLLEGTSAAELPEAAFNLEPVGSGPFQLEEVTIEDERITAIVLKQHTRYYWARPYLDRIQFRFYPGQQAVLDAYEAGQVEGIADIPASSLARARAFPDLNLYSAQIAEYSIVMLNLDDPELPFFQEPEVRQALLYGLDRQALIDGALEGQALVAHSPLMPGTWAYNDDVPRYACDPDEARTLLRQAGWWVRTGTGGLRIKDDEPLAFTLLTSSEPERRSVAHLLAQQWASIGVTVTVETAPSSEVRTALENHAFEAILINLSMPGDPDPYPFWHETQVANGQNYSGLVHRRISEIVEQARVSINLEKRRQLYYEFQDIFAQEVPALPLYIPVYTYGVDSRIQDVQMGPLMVSADRFRTIHEWWIVPRRVFVSEAEAGG